MHQAHRQPNFIICVFDCRLRCLWKNVMVYFCTFFYLFRSFLDVWWVIWIDPRICQCWFCLWVFCSGLYRNECQPREVWCQFAQPYCFSLEGSLNAYCIYVMCSVFRRARLSCPSLGLSWLTWKMKQKAFCFPISHPLLIFRGLESLINVCWFWLIET